MEMTILAYRIKEIVNTTGSSKKRVTTLVGGSTCGGVLKRQQTHGSELQPSAGVGRAGSPRTCGAGPPAARRRRRHRQPWGDSRVCSSATTGNFFFYFWSRNPDRHRPMFSDGLLKANDDLDLDRSRPGYRPRFRQVYPLNPDGRTD